MECSLSPIFHLCPPFLVLTQVLEPICHLQHDHSWSEEALHDLSYWRGHIPLDLGHDFLNLLSMDELDAVNKIFVVVSTPVLEVLKWLEILSGLLLLKLVQVGPKCNRIVFREMELFFPDITRAKGCPMGQNSILLTQEQTCS